MWQVRNRLRAVLPGLVLGVHIGLRAPVCPFMTAGSACGGRQHRCFLRRPSRCVMRYVGVGVGGACMCCSGARSARRGLFAARPTYRALVWATCFDLSRAALPYLPRRPPARIWPARRRRHSSIQTDGPPSHSVAEPLAGCRGAYLGPCVQLSNWLRPGRVVLSATLVNGGTEVSCYY